LNHTQWALCALINILSIAAVGLMAYFSLKPRKAVNNDVLINPKLDDSGNFYRPAKYSQAQEVGTAASIAGGIVVIL